MPRLHVELSDLLAHFRAFRAPMGVARVQMALLSAGEGLFEPMAHSRLAGGLRRLSPVTLAALIEGARAGGRMDAPDWVARLDAAEAELARAPAPDFAPGDRVASLGHLGEDTLRRLRGLQASHGVLVCVLFYDAIPLTVPEHCPPALVRDFAAQFVAMCLAVDRVVAISTEAARDFRRWQRRAVPGRDIPVGVAALDAPFPSIAAGALPAPHPQLAAVLPAPLDDGAPYVLCVSTLESRKNHVLLLQAWLTLLRRHGEAVVPRLVLVGRRGYGAEAALRLLENAPELGRKVVWLRDVGDATLAALYAGCLFSVFNSFHEGWGLPVTEALAYGKLVLAPDHTSLREAGGTAALYFTSQSEPELADLAWGLIRDPTRREALEAALPARTALRSWRAVAEGLAAEFLGGGPLPVPREPFPVGWRIPCTPPRPAALPALPPPAELLGQVLREGEGWGPQHPEGVWMLAGEARLRFPLDHALRAPLLMLELLAPPTAPAQLRLRAGPDGTWQGLTLAADERRCVEVALPPVGPGDLVVEFDTASHLRPHQRPEGVTLPLHLMLGGLMLCEADDLASRLRYAEDRLGLRRAG